MAKTQYSSLPDMTDDRCTPNINGRANSNAAASTKLGGADDNDTSGERVVLKKELNLLHATSIMAGIIIGSGIFVSPVSITHHCGSIGLSLCVWAGSGLLTLCMALSYCELGIMFQTSGAEYAYFRKTIGQWLAFVYALVMFVAVNPAFFALLALTTSIYIFQPFFPDCSPPPLAIKLLSICVVVAIVFLNSFYVRYVARAQTFFMFAKIGLLVAIIIAGFIQISKGKTTVIASGFKNTNSDPGAIAIAVYSGIFTFGGWQYIFMLIEEVKTPHKIVPRATIISFLLVIIIYLLTNIAYFSVMTVDDMMASNAVAVDFGRIAMGRFAVVIPVFVACSTIGALNGSIFGGSRVTYTAARDGSFPSVLSMIHVKYLTPTPAVCISCLLTCGFIVSGEAVSLLEYLGFVSCVMSAIALGVLLYLRWKEPRRKRPFRIPLVVPAVSLVLLVALAILGLVKDPANNAIGLVIGLLGLPVYLVFVKWENKPKYFIQFRDAVYIFTQKLLVVLPPEDTSSADSSSCSGSE